MNSNLDRKLALRLAVLASKSASLHSGLEQSLDAKEAQQADKDFTKEILALSKEAEAIEDVIAVEQSLQKLDLMRAKSALDKKSILATQKSYDQLTITITQMRKNPDGYFYANMSVKDTGDDPKKINKRNGLDHINGNITRMRNRSAFAQDSEREIWDARIVLAKKTGEMFKTLHTNLAANFERKLKIQEQLQEQQQQERDRKDKGRE